MLRYRMFLLVLAILLVPGVVMGGTGITDNAATETTHVEEIPEYAVIGEDVHVDGATVDGDIYSSDSVSIVSGAIEGTVIAEGEVTLDETVVEDVVHVSRSLSASETTIRDDVHVVGDPPARGSLALSDVAIDGDVYLGGDGVIENVTIGGDLHATLGPGDTLQCENVTVEGTLFTDAERAVDGCDDGEWSDSPESPMELSDEPAVSSDIPTAPVHDDAADIGGSELLLVDEQQTIPAGDYVLDRLEATQSTLIFDTSDGPVNLWYEGTGTDDIQFDESEILVEDNGTENEVNLYTTGSSSLSAELDDTSVLTGELSQLFNTYLDNQQDATLDGAGTYEGLLTAPATNHLIEIGQPVSGGIFAPEGEVHITEDVTLPSVFEVEIIDTTSPVVEGETMEFTAEITNPGLAEDTQNVSLTIGGESVDFQGVTLDRGEETTVTFEWETAVGDDGSHNATVSSDDDADSTTVEVLKQAEFVVDIVNTTSPVVEGEELVVTANVTNIGDVSDTQILELEIPGKETVSQELELAGGESKELSFEWVTETGDAGEYNVTVSSDDDAQTTPVEVLPDEDDGDGADDIESNVCRVDSQHPGAAGHEISNADDLQSIGDGEMGLDDDYVLTNNIDATDVEFEPIEGFEGTLYGQGYEIVGLTIDQQGEEQVGLFERADGATFYNLGIVDAEVSGGDYTGILAGRGNGIEIVNSCVTGQVTGEDYVGGMVGSGGSLTAEQSNTTVQVSGEMAVGGFAGQIPGFGSEITTSWTQGEVHGQTQVGGFVGDNFADIQDSLTTATVKGQTRVGGFVGLNENAWINESYASGDVTGHEQVGGFAGENSGFRPAVFNVYARGDVTGHTEVGGIVGLNTGTTQQTYHSGDVSGTSMVGGIAGRNTGGDVFIGDPEGVAWSYWNQEVSGVTDAVGANEGRTFENEGLTDSEMTGASAGTAMDGLNFVNIWATVPDTIVTDPDYPELQTFRFDDSIERISAFEYPH